MVIPGLKLNKVFYKKNRGSEHFSATLPLALKGWKFPVPTRPERMKAPSPTRPERAEAPSPGHRPGYVVCEPGALKGQKLYNITQPA